MPSALQHRRAGKFASAVHPMASAAATWPALLLFGSGAASLVYQLLWIKQLSLVVGVEVYAVTIAVSAFFAGLAIGGAWLGRVADRLQRPLRLYAWLEIAVALLAVAATMSLAHGAAPFALLEARAGWLAWLLPFALVGVPAVAMGGTLPVLVRAATRDSVARTGGRLYAANTAGAIVGVLAAPFVLLPAFGVQGSAWAAAAVNLLAAATALALDRGKALPSMAVAQDERLSPTARLALVLYAIAGGIALGYEVVWSQTVVQFMSTRAFAFAMMLAVYLLGLMIGSALYARIADRVHDAWSAFGVLIALAGLVALLQVVWLGPWLGEGQAALAAFVAQGTDSRLAAMCARFALAAIALVLAPTLLLGAAFPAVLRVCARATHSGRGVGLALALNTVGGIAGTMLTGFVLVPAFGLVRTLGLLAIAASLVGLVAVSRGVLAGRRGRRWVAAIAACSLAAAVLVPADKLASLLAQARGGEVTYYEESRGGTVAVLAQGREGGAFHRLYIQGVSNSGDTLPSRRYMRLQALLPLIIHRGEPRSALVIGFGTGITAGALSQYPGLSTRVCAELLPAVVRAASQFQGNYGAGVSDAGLDIRLRDGRRELLRSDERYDMITLEPPPPSASGVVNLYSRDFYRLAASRLNENGLVAQWWPIATQNDEDSKAMVRAFLDAFPHATLWTTELHEMLLVGSMQPIELDAPTIERRFAQPGVARALGDVGVATPGALLATWVSDRAGLVRYAGDTPAVTDDRPSIEYATWVRRNEIVRVLPELAALQSEPPLHRAGDALLADVRLQHDVLFTFYASGLAAYEGDQDRWGEALSQVMRVDGSNPYYRWIAEGAP